MNGKGDDVRPGWHIAQARANYDAIFRKVPAPKVLPKLSGAQLIELREYLQGMCKTLAEGMNDCGFEDHDEDDAAARLVEDGEIFLCECGWWCEIGEQDEVGLCADCHIDVEEPEELDDESDDAEDDD